MNLSVWEGVETLQRYVYHSAHGGVLKRPARLVREDGGALGGALVGARRTPAHRRGGQGTARSSARPRQHRSRVQLQANVPVASGMTFRICSAEACTAFGKRIVSSGQSSSRRTSKLATDFLPSVSYVRFTYVRFHDHHRHPRPGNPRLARQPHRRSRSPPRRRRPGPRRRAQRRVHRPARSLGTARRRQETLRRQGREEGRRGRQRRHRLRDLRGMDALDQVALDQALIELDGTDNKKKLGANAILGVSLATAHAAAAALGSPLFKYLGGPNAKVLPVPMMNVINGGAHSDAPIDFQEFMIMPKGLPTFSKALRAGTEIFHSLKAVLKKRGLSTAVGDEGGFAPKFKQRRRRARNALPGHRRRRVTSSARTSSSRSTRRPASSTTRKRRSTASRSPTAAERSADGTGRLLQGPLQPLPDHLHRGRLRGGRLGRLEAAHRRARRQGAARRRRSVRHQRRVPEEGHRPGRGQFDPREGQPDRHADRNARRHRTGQGKPYTAVISHRSGETEDTTIADIAVATNAGQIKTGSLCRTDRVAKYNQLLRIAEILGDTRTIWR